MCGNVANSLCALSVTDRKQADRLTGYTAIVGPIIALSIPPRAKNESVLARDSIMYVSVL